jgi:DnaK suppressor protein
MENMARKDSILSMRQILIMRRDALRTALAGDLSLLKELRAQTAGDVVDAALDSAQDEISSQLAEVESRELSSIENALQRMRDGQYGICESCGCSIPMARLNALPYATLCINCQREAERDGGAGMHDADWGRVLDGGSDGDVSINDIEIDV